MRCRGSELLHGADGVEGTELTTWPHDSWRLAGEFGATLCDAALEVVELELGAGGDEILNGDWGCTIHGRTPAVIDPIELPQYTQ